MSHVKHRVGCFYISTFRSMCVVPDMAVFLKLGAAKGPQGFREKKICNGGRVLLAVQNLYECK